MSRQSILNDRSVLRLVQIALSEDIGSGDLSSESLLADAESIGRATFIAKSPGVVAGISISELVFHEVDRGTVCQWNVEDGALVKKGSVLGTVEGPLGAILTGERTALNFLQRMSGVATKTAAFVKAINGTNATILDTRKTIPGWRLLDKYAVTCGGGSNHRMGLFDMVMIKDNHIAAHGSITKAVSAVHKYFKKHGIKNVPVEVETKNLDEVNECLACSGVQRIMFDNFTVKQIRQGVKLVAGKLETEASGDVSLETVRSIADTGVQFISVGSLTHSVTAMNISLDVGT